MDVRHCAAVLSVLVVFAVLCISDGQQDCESGSACFPGGRGVPDDVSVNDLAYYCCPEKNTTRNSTRTNGTVDFCTCRPDFTLDEKIQKWADGSKNLGRMCSRGETACSGSKSNSTTNFRFKTCCWPQQGFTVTTTIFDGDKEEYIGCRCNTSIPSPDPRAYIVPQTAMYNSTGEVCSYDKGCDHKPSLKCTSPEATFCCYGSRGIVTENDGDSLTRCTCTNQVFGEMCESAPVPIPQTPLDGQQDCESGSACFPGGRGVPDDVSVNDLAYYCCPEKNTTRNSTRTNGTVDFCTCRPDFTLDEKIQKWADGSKNLGRMCSRGETACSGSKSNSTTNFRFKTCCWPQQGFTSSYKHTTTIIFDGDKEEYIGCRCNTSIPSPDPRAYIVPQTAMYNSTGEVCSYDKGCDHKPSLKCTSPEATFCCYGSRGIVTENDGDSLTRCTCTNQVFGEMCESAPVPIPQTPLDGQQDCESGSACFRGGRGVPDDVSVNDLAYYCCPEKNTTRNSTRTNGTVDFCTCRPDFTLDEKIQKWADGSKNLGRMCSRGETACSGSKSNSTTNFRFKTCCWPQQGFTSSYKHTTTIIFDGDKEEYIGCRCNTSIPSPDPRAYIVPQTAMYNSTGEVCSYDKGCDHKPSLKCTSPEATFCCYGSRGIVTENDGDSLTRCTCTNQVFGEMCESAPVPIPQTPLDGQQDCESGSACFRGGRGVPDDVSVNDLAYYCCPEKNTTRNSTRTNGTVDFCTCRPDFTLDEKIQKWADGSKNLGRMCSRGETACSGSKSNSTTNFRFKTCCWPQQGFTSSFKHTTTIFDGDKEEYIGCRCNTSIPSPDPRAYIVPQTAMYNSTGEVCSYDKGCDHKPSLKCTSPEATFCCYGSRGIVTENDGDSLTRCTCTNQVFGEMCESAPVPIPQTQLACLSDCSGKDDDDVVCKDDQGNERCCAHNMAVKVTLHNGIISDCTCTTAKDKSCVTSSAPITDKDTSSAPTTDKDTSSAPTFLLQSAAQLLVLVLSAALLGQRNLIH